VSESSGTGGQQEAVFSFSWNFFRRRAPLSAVVLARRSVCQATILFLPVSAPQDKLATDWAEGCDKVILRRCPLCKRESIVGHGCRRKQAHDADHDWIRIRRGYCKCCRKSFTFLPPFSLPYTHYSLLAHVEALRRRFLECRSWDEAVPTLKDSQCLPDPSTVRRWSMGMDLSRLWPSFFDRVLARVACWRADRDQTATDWGLIPALAFLCPLRL